MSFGLQMMIKSLGIDPEEVVKQVTEIASYAKAYDQKLDLILAQQAFILEKLDVKQATNLELEYLESAE